MATGLLTAAVPAPHLLPPYGASDSPFSSALGKIPPASRLPPTPIWPSDPACWSAQPQGGLLPERTLGRRTGGQADRRASQPAPISGSWIVLWGGVARQIVLGRRDTLNLGLAALSCRKHVVLIRVSHPVSAVWPEQLLEIPREVQ